MLGKVGDDFIVGSSAGGADFEARGSWGDDTLALDGPDGVLLGGPDQDLLAALGQGGLLEGRNGHDTLVSDVFGINVEMRGQSGADKLCSRTGETMMVANDTVATSADELFVPATFMGTFSLGTTANSANAFCGSTAHNPTMWAGTCLYSLVLPPPECEEFME